MASRHGGPLLAAEPRLSTGITLQYSHDSIGAAIAKGPWRHERSHYEQIQ